MIENYKLDKLAGPSFVVAGYILLFFGCITLYFTLVAVPVILTGATMAFSYKGTRIKFDKKRHQSYIKLFGIIRFGFWMPFEKSDILFVEQFQRKNNPLSKTRRDHDKERNDFRILLNTSYNNKKIAIARFQNEKEANEKMKELSDMINAMKI
jgi:hypothetical protein